MATVHVRHDPNYAAIARLFVADKVQANMFIRGLRVETRAKVEISSNPRRVDTGRLRSSIHTSRITRVIVYPRKGARVGTNVHYARYVHDGTGIYGPRHMPIVPTTKQVLRFRPKGSMEYVYARSVRGMRRNQYLLNALPAARL